MKKIIFLGFCITMSLAAFAQTPKDFTKYVNPFIGTGGHGHTYPGPSYPFGMIQPGPDTRLEGWDGCSGYHYTDNALYGFSQTHLSGTGIADYCDFLIMPTTGKPEFKNTDYASTFQKKNEKAAAGYYSTILDKYKIKAEVTAGKRSGLYRFTFPAGKESNIIIDLKHRDRVLDSWVEVVNDREIKGYRKSKAWSQGQELYFHLKFNKPFRSYGISSDEQVKMGQRRGEGNNLKLVVTFNTIEKESILAKISISAVDEKGALNNLNSELAGFDFAATLAANRKAWNHELKKVEAISPDINKLTTFYTALYHTFLNPNLYMDADSRYRGLDKKIHKAVGFEYYSVFSLWDTYRTEHPLLTLLDKKRSLDFIKTFLAMHQQGGLLPIWPLAEDETFCMIGNHAIPVITDAYAKGIRGFDTELALKAMKHAANRKQFGIDVYRDHGAVMADKEHESASKTVEYAYDDWCIAQFAKMLGKTEDYNTYISRAQNWKNVFDPSSNHIRARNNGGWWKPFNPTEVNNNYTEGNSWHYTFSTQQDVNGHISLMGGEPIFQNKLDELFTTSEKLSGRDQSDITGLIGQYAHGNEPSHHMAYLFNFTSHPEKTQYYVNRLMNEQYHNRPDGLSGNEDCGQMSAWLVMSAMGLYPLSPGNNMYMIGTPWFSKITINLPSGKKMVINAPGKNPGNYYIKGMQLNSLAYKKLYISYENIAKGGNFTFSLSASPDKKYLSSLERPVMLIKDNRIVPNPVINGPQETFKGSAEVTLSDAEKDVQIFYTTDGSAPDEGSLRYAQPFKINKSTTIKAIGMKPGYIKSYVSIANYKLIETNYTIKINSEINRSYTGGGTEALIDGVRGEFNWRVGNRWQGFWGHDFEAIADLGKVQHVSSISLGAIQDTNAWIVFPPETSFYISADGINFTLAGTVKAPMEARDYTISIRELQTNVNAGARFIKIVAKNYGTLPSWHEGAGGKAHLFFDELTIK